MSFERDVAAFDERATHYEQGWLGRLHRDIAEKVATLALSTHPEPLRVLDVGCGTGYLLDVIASRCPTALALVGIDPAPGMIDVAAASTREERLTVQLGVAERLPFPDDAFDLVVSTTSFDHWSNQGQGIRECARVLAPAGHIVLADLFSALLVPTLLASRRGKARTKARANRLLVQAGLRVVGWHRIQPLISAVTATR